MDLEALLGPLVEGMDLELVEVGFAREGGRRVLRVTVDREGGVDLDTIVQASERVSRRLDLEGVGGGPYTLEVSSPGVERPLRTPAHFVRKVGEKVRVKASDGEGIRTLVGTLAAVGEGGVKIETEGGLVEMAFTDIVSARTVFEWGPKDKRSRK
jgi:ribosome maturation factor RimP